MESIIGRSEEKLLITELLASGEAELVAVYGRRRVGKTFLIRNVFEKQLVFEFSGIHNASLSVQLENFSQSLTSAAKSSLAIAPPSNWMQAFKMLKDYLSPLLHQQKKVVFFDEFPWINTHKSGFLQAFEHFWNTWASTQKNIIVVICGSAATWMIKKVLNNKGGLHNRVTRKIRLLPFNMMETEAYLKSRKINLDRYQLLQLYMVMGGIPQYLKEIRVGESAAQAIDRTCFTKDGLLFGEFHNLYHSLFENADKHIELIKHLAGKPAGYTRNELIKKTGLTTGGGTTKLLEELSESGFIHASVPFGKSSKDAVYKLSDEYSRFYLKFIDNTRARGAGTWLKLSREAGWKSWSGMAFEQVCLKHEENIKKALGIWGVYTETSVWRFPGSNEEQGVQIDLLIDRQDRCINICEIKFSETPFTIEKAYAAQLLHKKQVFQEKTKTRKTIFITLITSFGVKQNIHYTGLVQNDFTMDILFS